MGENKAIVQPIIISDELVPVAAYQAIYHKITKKTEVLGKSYIRPSIVKKTDIEHLHNLICQAVTQYKVQERSCEINVSIENDHNLEFSSFERFKLHSFSSNNSTEELSYKFDMLTVIPTEIDQVGDVAQRYIIRLLVGQNTNEYRLRPYEAYRLYYKPENIDLSITYADYSTARALQSCIDGWVDSLERTAEREAPDWVSSAMTIAQSFVPKLFAAGVAFYLARNSHPFGSLQLSLQQSLLICAAILWMTHSLAIVSGNIILSRISVLLPRGFVLITNGDTSYKQRHDDGRSQRKAIVTAGTILLLGIPIGIIVNWISVYLISQG